MDFLGKRGVHVDTINNTLSEPTKSSFYRISETSEMIDDGTLPPWAIVVLAGVFAVGCWWWYNKKCQERRQEKKNIILQQQIKRKRDNEKL
jgi:cbb3-type cytochrome oxidase subunit 3